MEDDGNSKKKSTPEVKHSEYLQQLQERNRLKKLFTNKTKEDLLHEERERGFSTHFSGANLDKKASPRLLSNAASVGSQKAAPSMQNNLIAPQRIASRIESDFSEHQSSNRKGWAADRPKFILGVRLDDFNGNGAGAAAAGSAAPNGPIALIDDDDNSKLKAFNSQEAGGLRKSRERRAIDTEEADVEDYEEYGDDFEETSFIIDSSSTNNNSTHEQPRRSLEFLSKGDYIDSKGLLTPPRNNVTTKGSDIDIGRDSDYPTDIKAVPMFLRHDLPLLSPRREPSSASKYSTSNSSNGIVTKSFSSPLNSPKKQIRPGGGGQGQPAVLERSSREDTATVVTGKTNDSSSFPLQKSKSRDSQSDRYGNGCDDSDEDVASSRHGGAGGDGGYVSSSSAATSALGLGSETKSPYSSQMPQQHNSAAAVAAVPGTRATTTATEVDDDPRVKITVRIRINNTWSKSKFVALEAVRLRMVDPSTGKSTWISLKSFSSKVCSGLQILPTSSESVRQLDLLLSGGGSSSSSGARRPPSAGGIPISDAAALCWKGPVSAGSALEVSVEGYLKLSLFEGSFKSASEALAAMELLLWNAPSSSIVVSAARDVDVYVGAVCVWSGSLDDPEAVNNSTVTTTTTTEELTTRTFRGGPTRFLGAEGRVEVGMLPGRPPSSVIPLSVSKSMKSASSSAAVTSTGKGAAAGADANDVLSGGSRNSSTKLFAANKGDDDQEQEDGDNTGGRNGIRGGRAGVSAAAAAAGAAGGAGGGAGGVEDSPSWLAGNKEIKSVAAKKSLVTSDSSWLMAAAAGNDDDDDHNAALNRVSKVGDGLEHGTSSQHRQKQQQQQEESAMKTRASADRLGLVGPGLTDEEYSSSVGAAGKPSRPSSGRRPREPTATTSLSSSEQPTDTTTPLKQAQIGAPPLFSSGPPQTRLANTQLSSASFKSVGSDAPVRLNKPIIFEEIQAVPASQAARGGRRASAVKPAVSQSSDSAAVTAAGTASAAATPVSGSSSSSREVLVSYGAADRVNRDLSSDYISSPPQPSITTNKDSSSATKTTGRGRGEDGNRSGGNVVLSQVTESSARELLSTPSEKGAAGGGGGGRVSVKSTEASPADSDIILDPSSMAARRARRKAAAAASSVSTEGDNKSSSVGYNIETALGRGGGQRLNPNESKTIDAQLRQSLDALSNSDRHSLGRLGGVLGGPPADLGSSSSQQAEVFGGSSSKKLVAIAEQDHVVGVGDDKRRRPVEDTAVVMEDSLERGGNLGRNRAPPPRRPSNSTDSSIARTSKEKEGGGGGGQGSVRSSEISTEATATATRTGEGAVEDFVEETERQQKLQDRAKRITQVQATVQSTLVGLMDVFAGMTNQDSAVPGASGGSSCDAPLKLHRRAATRKSFAGEKEHEDSRGQQEDMGSDGVLHYKDEDAVQGFTVDDDDDFAAMEMASAEGGGEVKRSSVSAAVDKHFQGAKAAPKGSPMAADFLRRTSISSSSPSHGLESKRQREEQSFDSNRLAENDDLRASARRESLGKHHADDNNAHHHTLATAGAVDDDDELLDRFDGESSLLQEYQQDLNAAALNASSMSGDAGRLNFSGSMSDTFFSTPVLPPGRVLRVEILSTWGDQYYVGLNGIDIFDQDGKLLSTGKGDNSSIAEITGNPSSVNVLSEYHNDPRHVRNLVDGCNFTRDDLHVWLAPQGCMLHDQGHADWDRGAIATVTIEFKRVVSLSMVRIFNYNKSRTHCTRGVRNCRLRLDGKIIFEGEIRMATGLLTSADTVSEVVLFATDTKILEKVAKHDEKAGYYADDSTEQWLDKLKDRHRQARPRTADREEGSAEASSAAAAAPSASWNRYTKAPKAKRLDEDEGDDESTDRLGSLLPVSVSGQQKRRASGAGTGTDTSSIDFGARPVTGLNFSSSDELTSSGFRASASLPALDSTSGGGGSKLSESSAETLKVANLHYPSSYHSHDLPGGSLIGVRAQKPQKPIIKELKLQSQSSQSKSHALDGSGDDLNDLIAMISEPMFKSHLLDDAEQASRTLSTAKSSSSAAAAAAAIAATQGPRGQVKGCGVGFFALNESDLVSCRRLTVRFESTWGDRSYAGLCGLEVLLGLSYTPADLEPKHLDAYPRDLSEVGCFDDPRVLENIVNGFNDTTDDRNMWLIPFTEGATHELKIDLGRSCAVAGIRVWNYNKSAEDSLRGVKSATIFADGRPLGRTIFRPGPGLDGVEFGQFVFFRDVVYPTAKKCPGVNLSSSPSPSLSSSSSKDGKGSGPIGGLTRYITPAVKQDYEVPLSPSGLLWKFSFFENWFDGFYIGLDAIEMFDNQGNIIDILASGAQIAAVPFSLQDIDPQGNQYTHGPDPRTPDKLFLSSSSSSSTSASAPRNHLNNRTDTEYERGKHSWLAPLSRSMTPTERMACSIRVLNAQKNRSLIPTTLYPDDVIQCRDNVLYVMFNYPVAVSCIRIYNYSKHPTRGAKEFGIEVDGLTVYTGTLRPADKENMDAGGGQSIIFTNDPKTIRNEKDRVTYCGMGDQDVLCIDERQVKVRANHMFSQPNPSAEGVSSDLSARYYLDYMSCSTTIPILMSRKALLALKNYYMSGAACNLIILFYYLTRVFVFI